MRRQPIRAATGLGRTLLAVATASPADPAPRTQFRGPGGQGLIRCVGDPVRCAPNIGSGGHLGTQRHPLFVGNADNHPALPTLPPEGLHPALAPEHLADRRRLLAVMVASLE